MNKTIAFAGIALLIASPLVARSAAEKTGVNSVLGMAPKTEDFVAEAATSDMFEIESSKLALERSDDATKAFAQQMIADHEKTTGELKGLVSSGKVQAQVPTAMTSAQPDMLNKLKGLQGADFNKQYHSDQEDAHTDAVDLFKRYGDSGDNSDLKAWAASTRPTLEHHLQMVTDLNERKVATATSIVKKNDSPEAPDCNNHRRRRQEDVVGPVGPFTFDAREWVPNNQQLPLCRTDWEKRHDRDEQRV